MAKEKQNFSNYMNDILQNSMITGIPQIAGAGSWPKRIVRALVFLLCAAGFIYQTLTFMWMYWNYDVIVDVRVSNPAFVEKPAFTVCIAAGLKATEFCKVKDPAIDEFQSKYGHWEYCQYLRNNTFSGSFPYMCDCNPRLCDRKGKLLNISHLSSDRTLPFALEGRHFIEKYLLTPSEMMKCVNVNMRRTNTMSNCFNDSHIIQVPCMASIAEAESCFTVDSIVGRPNATIESVFSNAEIRLTLDVHPELPINYHLYNYMKISFHNPYTIQNPLENFQRILSGRYYTFRLRKIIRKLLPYPYTTDCMDYRKLWHERGGRGPTNILECIQECQKNMSMEKHGCVYAMLPYVGNDPRCGESLQDRDFMFDSKECFKKDCKPACLEEYYEYDLSTGDIQKVDCYMDNYREVKREAFVKIRLDSMETTTYTYSAKYKGIETFSYVGGYVGMWLGISLLAVFDFVETLYAVIKYPIRRYSHYKKRRDGMNRARLFSKVL